MRNDTEKNEQSLNRIIAFITNCDSKASITIALFGLLITMMPNGFESFINTYNRIQESQNENELFLFAMIALLLFISIIFIIFSIVELALVLKANFKKSDKNSLLYFTDIASYKLDAFLCKNKKANLNDYKRDLLNQIYINSHICTKKYTRYNRGLVAGLIGFFIFL